MNVPSQPNRSSQRFRLPAHRPLRELFIASMCATIGSLEVIAWATLGLSGSLLAAGIVLITIGLSYGLWSLYSSWRMRWVVRVGPEALVVTRGSRHSELSWSQLGTVGVAGRKVAIFDRQGRRREALAFDGNRQADAQVKDMLEAIQERRVDP